MTARTFAQRWNAFWFEPEWPGPVALFRITFGTVNVAMLLAMHRDWLRWFGTHAVVSIATTTQMAFKYVPLASPRIGILALWPHTDAGVMTLFWVVLAAASCLTVGLCTRLSSIVVFLGLLATQARNPFIMSGGDQLLRLTGFFLMFAPAGATFSLDRLLRVRWGWDSPEVAPRSPTALRMIQLQVAIMYMSTAWWKLLGHSWVHGSALYFALHAIEFRRFPVPGLESPLFIGLVTWGALAVEMSAGTLIWFRKLRYPVLVALLGLHLGIEYSMNIPFFEWITLATLVTFIYPDDLARAVSWARRRVALVSAPAVARPATPSRRLPVAH